MPLADEIRPRCLDELVGQRHLLAPGRPLFMIAQTKKLPNMIFYGPPGTGKTTVARILADNADMRLHKLNGTSASLADIKKVIAELPTLLGQNGLLLYLDEIQYLNKKQQQSLLEYIENGSITLIASTTENPYFYIYNAILSRATVFEFRPISKEDLLPAISRGFDKMAEITKITCKVEPDALDVIASGCGGDVRKALNTVELCALCAKDQTVTKQLAKELTQKSANRYDREGDEHYDLLSALQKSIRGSDENAALHYLARLLDAGDLLSPCRRILVTACEDVGLAYPNAIAIVKACVDSAIQLGLPEARIPLAQAVVLLATAPKSNSAYLGIDRALEDVKVGKGIGFPRCLQNKHLDGEGSEERGQHYLYPHDFHNHFVRQQYLPDDLLGTVYYVFGENRAEQAAKAYREKITKELSS